MASEKSSITIRDLQDGDLESIADIYKHAVLNTTATYELDPPSPSALGGRLHAIREAGFPCFVAENSSSSSSDMPRILGYAYASEFRPRPGYRYTVEHSIYVASSARGHGVGTLLMDALIKACEGLGFRQMVAVIGEGGDTSPSVLFHRKLGFRYAGTLEGSGYKFGRWLDTVFMQRAINGGTGSLPDST
ncbi:phosphinotricin acetyltransferase [Canariomyces notabilis]|uniref:Phosphinotricin acetyltransferase n=1 Tax=Canariomyces notabilis TaxID=2074819 RepID=A0AAN6QLL8_9PEZI|nr:phosphinotricin acetyltransferase [Canariomyces arenarius]